MYRITISLSSFGFRITKSLSKSVGRSKSGVYCYLLADIQDIHDNNTNHLSATSLLLIIYRCEERIHLRAVHVVNSLHISIM